MITKLYEKTKEFIKKEWKFLLFLVLFILFTNLRLPYLIEAPGGAIELTDRVEIDGAYDAEGSFNMAYVTMIKGTPATLLMAVFRNSWDIIRYEDVTLENEDYEDSVNRDKLYLQESLANATIAAYKEAGAKLEITNSMNQVVYISKDAKTTLQVNDEILTVNGVECHTLEEMKEITASLVANDTVHFVVRREGKEQEAEATLYDSEDGAKVGLITITKYEYSTDPTIEIGFKDSESGPSGGLMTALEIYNQLTSEDLTKGRKIIGTGTIEVDGRIGEIGGVKYKLAGAVKEKAEVFLCPMENLEEALALKEKFKYDIEVIGVSQFHEAISVLKEG